MDSWLIRKPKPSNEGMRMEVDTHGEVGECSAQHESDKTTDDQSKFDNAHFCHEIQTKYFCRSPNFRNKHAITITRYWALC